MPNEKPTARSYSASAKTTAGLSPLSWGDKCFLCGNTIAEAAPIGFYQGKNSFMRCHRGCLDKMEMAGGTPKDFHKLMEGQGTTQPPVHDQPVHQDIVQARMEVDIPQQQYTGPRSIKFNDLQHLQDFILQRGALPDSVRVFIGDYVVQAGG